MAMADEEGDWEVFWSYDGWHAYRERCVGVFGMIPLVVLELNVSEAPTGCRRFSQAGQKFESLTHPSH